MIFIQRIEFGMEANDSKFSKEIIDKFHEIYNGNNDNLKKIPPIFLEMGGLHGYVKID
ncbi:hypothetical protein SAMN05428949_6494 [Chitinophaga sp. YR627]|nr:hypothetical protein SAMN05428949_6494 [Chitinophaga sp. YR627]